MRPIPVIGGDLAHSLCRIAAVAPLGCFVEFGVYQGGSAWHLAKIAEAFGREIYLYDTFEGIPCKADIDVHVVGDFGDTSYEAVCELIPYAKVIKGVFPESLVEMPPIAFAHIDADQYDSITAAIDVLGPKMAQGAVMVFDDYGCLAGATQAVKDKKLAVEMTDCGKAMVRF